MVQPKVIVLRTAGTNCDEETCHAFELVGAVAERVHVNRLIESPQRRSQCGCDLLPGDRRHTAAWVAWRSTGDAEGCVDPD